MSDTHGNCWSYALALWLVHPIDTYIIVRMSRHKKIPHMFFAKSIEGLPVQEYKPDHPKHGWRAFFHAIWYKGHIRIGVGEYKQLPPVVTPIIVIPLVARIEVRTIPDARTCVDRRRLNARFYGAGGKRANVDRRMRYTSA